MTIPTEITIRHLEKTPAIENNIREKVKKMELFFDRIESCKVVVEYQQKQQHKGKLYSVFIEALVPGKKLIVNRRANENLYIAIRDSFAAMSKQIKDYARKTNGTVKTHPELTTGYIDRLYSDYGFIESMDGTEYYFSSDNVLNSEFENLEEGMLVRFLEAEAGDTLQASHVMKLTNGQVYEKAA